MAMTITSTTLKRGGQELVVAVARDKNKKTLARVSIQLPPHCSEETKADYRRMAERYVKVLARGPVKRDRHKLRHGVPKR